MLIKSKKQTFKLEIITRYLSGKIPRIAAIKSLQVSEDTFRRYCRAYEKNGVLFMKHGNSDKRPHNRMDENLRNKIKTLIVMKYYDFNVQHLREKLWEIEGIKVGRETLRKIVSELNMIKEPKRKREPKYRRDRMMQAGLMIQMDGSEHAWFGTKKSVLIAGIDDATSEVWAEFFWAEDTIGYMQVLLEIIRLAGLPHVLYTDRAGLWDDRKRAEFTQMRRACEELGISWIPANSPEAKGRIERLFKTLQDRLIPEMRIRGITTMAEANRYLKSEFLPGQYFENFAVEPENPETAWRYPALELPLEEILCLKYQRKILKNHTISWKNKYFDLIPPDGVSLAGHSIEIRVYPSGLSAAYYRRQRIALKEVNAPIKILKG